MVDDLPIIHAAVIVLAAQLAFASACAAWWCVGQILRERAPQRRRVTFEREDS